MYGSSSSFGTCSGGPAGTWITREFGYHVTTSGCSAASRRVNTSTSTPRSARHRLRCATYTFCPPASALPSAASGDAWSLIIAILCICRQPPCVHLVACPARARANHVVERVVPIAHEALDREAALGRPSCEIGRASCRDRVKDWVVCV